MRLVASYLTLQGALWTDPDELDNFESSSTE